MRESYIKDAIIPAVNCIVLPLVDISVVLCKDVVFPPKIEILYLLIASEFIDICQRKGKVYSNGNPVKKKKKRKEN